MVSLAQLTYPLLALAEVGVLSGVRRSRAGNATAIRTWMAIQIGLFCVLEPVSFLAVKIYPLCFIGAVVVSAGADMLLFLSIYRGLENRVCAFGSVRFWSLYSVFFGLLAAFCVAEAIPESADSVRTVWLIVDQTYTYIRAFTVIGLSLYGWLRGSSWPRDLAWSWIGLALYGIGGAVAQRLELVFNQCSGPLEMIATATAFMQVLCLWRALSYAPKPVSALELHRAQDILSPHSIRAIQ